MFQVHKLYKRGEENNVQGMIKKGRKGGKPQKRPEREVSQVLRTKYFTVFVAILDILQISMWT
jgi:hypothetical protein